MIVVDTQKLKEFTTGELKQKRGQIHKLLHESDSELETTPGVKEINEGLTSELIAVNEEIRRKEGKLEEEAAHARALDRASRGEYETADAMLIKPSESVHSFAEARGMIRDRYDGLSLGATARSLVTGPRNEMERRQLSEGSDSAGGVTVATDVLTRSVDLLRAASRVVQLGGQSLMLDTEKTVIAKLTGDPTVSWRLENGVVTPSDPTFDSVLLQARSVACLVKVSRELLDDSINIDQMLNRAFIGSMAAEVDRVCLVGSGSAPEPQGVVGADNVNVEDMQGNDFTDYDPFVNAVVKCWQSNSQTVSGIVMSPANLGILAKLKEAVNLQPLQKPALLQDIVMTQTTNCPNDVAIVGDFGQLILGFRSQVRIEVLRELYAEHLQFGFLVHMRFDVGLSHPEAFCEIDNISLS
jgi:HK97 family phage major capsid protein